MKNNANPFKKMAIFSVAVFLASLFILSIPEAAKKPWDGSITYFSRVVYYEAKFT